MVDFYKQLTVLQNDWSDCTACSLGEQRAASGGAFVFGEGERRGFMFIGEGPGKDEEREGRPFIGKSGAILRDVIQRLQLFPTYITNVVSCRSCGQQYDNEGNPKYRKQWKTGVLEPMILDQPPSPVQMNACLPRLHEQIYLVDPILIVSLGREATQALTRKAVSIREMSGKMMTVSIPGRGFHASVTDKKHLWVRKVRGQVVMPVEQNEVVYPLIPVLHPSHILRNKEDRRPGNPVEMFVNSMKLVRDIYSRYVIEVHGDTTPALAELTEEDVLESALKED